MFQPIEIPLKLGGILQYGWTNLILAWLVYQHSPIFTSSSVFCPYSMVSVLQSVLYIAEAFQSFYLDSQCSVCPQNLVPTLRQYLSDDREATTDLRALNRKAWVIQPPSSSEGILRANASWIDSTESWTTTDDQLHRSLSPIPVKDDLLLKPGLNSRATALLASWLICYIL